MKKMTKWERIKKVLKPRHIIVLILLLVANSFAWFIYSTRVSNTMTAHVRAWDVLFESGDSPITDYITVTVDNMYPGMTAYHYELKAYNKSEVGATLTYTVLSANILGTTYTTVEGRAANNEAAVATDLTSDELVTKLKTGYPFAIAFATTSTTLDATTGEAYYTIDVTWPFESGDDAADTQWGIKANTYKTTNPTSPSIELKVAIYITQNA